MTTPNHPTGQPSPAWQRHHEATETAMHAYLTTTYAAHRAYLTGPYPDRDAYNAVEVSAWMTYHAKCRAAWNTYQAETMTPPPPRFHEDATPTQYPVSENWDHGESVKPWIPTFTPNQEGNQ